MSTPFFKRILSKPPMLFPWVALFHIVLFGVFTYNAIGEPLSSASWAHPLWMLAYTTFWLLICDLKKFAVLAYGSITAINAVLNIYNHFYLHSVSLDLYIDAIFPADIIFSIFALYYYRFFE